MKRTYDPETWVKIGMPDLTNKMYMKDKNGNKIFGRVTSLYRRKGMIVIKMEPFKKRIK
jgi:hypothetical protein